MGAVCSVCFEDSSQNNADSSTAAVPAPAPPPPSRLAGRRNDRAYGVPCTLDTETFEFVDAVHLPRQSSVDRNRPAKRSSLVSWLSGLSRGSRGSITGSFAGGRDRSQPRSIKILMSGTGESGKTTVIKQMKIIHQGGFTAEELRDFRTQIYRNVHDSMLAILNVMRREELGPDEATLAAIATIKALDSTRLEGIDRLSDGYIASINHLWVEVIRSNYDQIVRRTPILDSAPYFFDEICRIGCPNFVPTNQDVLRARTQTTGITEYNFKSGPLNIRMVDVGGQRPERRKWIETFDGVTTVLFCVALSEYDQSLSEEPRQNRLMETFQLWEALINSKWFQRASIVLFLNKKDIFRQKLRNNPLGKYFGDYRPPEGANEEVCFEHATEFLKNKFLQLNHQKLQIYPYLTCATDTNNINMVFAAVKETVLANNLRNAGLL